jgi:hypothetical protein
MSPDPGAVSLDQVQAMMLKSVLAGDDGALPAAIVPGGITAADRLAIHRNNTFVSLIEALGATFPVIGWLVGDDYFRAATTAYIRVHPPSMPQLSTYGDGFADFLAEFDSDDDTPYLPDVARLEWAHTEAYFAPQATPLAGQDFAAVPPHAYATLRLALHPTARLVASPYPVLRIWEAHRAPTVSPVDLATGGEHVLVLRPGQEVRLRAITAGNHALLKALSAGADLTAAAAAADACEPDFTLEAALADHLIEGTFGSFSMD